MIVDQMIQAAGVPLLPAACASHGMDDEMHDYRDLLDHITRLYPDLSPQLRKAAGYLLENPGQVATLSMRKVAAAAEVPPPTLPRLSKSLGFDTYEALREVYRKQFQDQAQGYSEQAGRLQEGRGDQDPQTLWSAFRQSSLDSVSALFAGLDGEEMARIADRLLAARQVYVVGMQASAAFASYFHYVGHMAKANWVLARNRNGVMADGVVDMGPEDVLVALSIRPCAKDAVRMAQMAQDRGTLVVGITDSRTTALAARSDICLTVQTQSPQFFESYLATTALFEALLGFVVARSGQEAVDNIERIERTRRELGEYWDSEPSS